MDKARYFISIFKKAEKKFGNSKKRLAGDAWSEPWQTLITTILSAQSRDEVTIPIAETLFRNYPSLDNIANADYSEIFKIIKPINYNKTKTKNVIKASRLLIENFSGKIPENMEDLLKIPGVGRKTANLVLTTIHNKDSICVDTHVHRISNVLGLVKTKTPEQTEYALKKIVPKKYWSRINRLFVLWGKSVSGRDRERLLRGLE